MSGADATLTQQAESNPILKLSFGHQIVGCCHSSGSEHASMFTFPLGAGFDLMNFVHVCVIYIKRANFFEKLAFSKHHRI